MWCTICFCSEYHFYLECNLINNKHISDHYYNLFIGWQLPAQCWAFSWRAMGTWCSESSQWYWRLDGYQCGGNSRDETNVALPIPQLRVQILWRIIFYFYISVLYSCSIILLLSYSIISQTYFYLLVLCIRRWSLWRSSILPEKPIIELCTCWCPPTTILFQVK